MPDVPVCLKIDFVSDVVCPWCVIGLHALEQALRTLDGTVTTELHFQPFELNPHMPPEGEDLAQHLIGKYGISATQLAQNHAALRARGAAVGFAFDFDRCTRICNTLDAHRLLHWAGVQGRQLALQHALFAAYFGAGEDLAAHAVLARAAEAAGLNGTQAAALLVSDRYADAVRAAVRRHAERGIGAVPTIIVNGRQLIAGAQPPEVFAQALRQVAQASAST